MADVELSTLGSVIKTAYEGQANTNAFTDANSTKLAGIEASADVTDEANVVAALDGATLTDVGSPASTDRILLQDASDSNNLKYADFSEFGGGSSAFYLFEATDKTGATDVTSELAALLATADGDLVYIPDGVYKLSNLNVAYDVNVSCSSNATFVYDYASDNRAIRQRNEDDATNEQAISAISIVRWQQKEDIIRCTVTDASAYAKGDVVNIHSQDQWLNSQTDNRRLGFSAKVSSVDTINEYVYLDRRHPYVEEGLITTSPRINKYGTKKFTWKGGIFKANGDYDDVSLGVSGNRRAAIEVSGTPYVKIHDVEFEELWSIGIRLVGCPFSDISRIRGRRLLNLLTDNDTNITITNINTTTGIITTSGAHGFSAGNDIVFWDIVGTTELNQRAFRVSSTSLGSNTFRLDDYYGDDTDPLGLTGYTAYVSGGTVATADINGLGYLVQLYASCCSSVVEGVKAEEGRHGVVTSDGITDGTYSTTQWYEYGQPSFVTIQNCVSSSSYGIPFDTHEEGTHWTFINCVANLSHRGPEGGSYSGCGFQLRSINNTILNCAVIGGTWGIRISQSDTPIQSRDIIQGCVFRECQGANDDGRGIYLFPEDSSPTTWNHVTIKDCMFHSCDIGFYSSGSGSPANIVFAGSNNFVGCKIGIRLRANISVKATGRLEFDIVDSFYTGSTHRAIRSDGASEIVLLGGVTMIHDATNAYSELIYNSAAHATTQYVPTNMFIQDDNGTTAATKTGGSGTFPAYADASTT